MSTDEVSSPHHPTSMSKTYLPDLTLYNAQTPSSTAASTFPPPPSKGSTSAACPPPRSSKSPASATRASKAAAPSSRSSSATSANTAQSTSTAPTARYWASGGFTISVRILDRDLLHLQRPTKLRRLLLGLRLVLLRRGLQRPPRVKEV